MNIGQTYTINGFEPTQGKLLWIRGNQFFFKYIFGDCIILRHELSRFVS